MQTMISYEDQIKERAQLVKLKLRSDYIDFYDHHFDLEGQEFQRFSYGGMFRPKMLQYLHNKGLFVPTHGAVKQLATHPFPPEKLVVYTDESAHKGEGKELLDTKDALAQYPNAYATEYFHPGHTNNAKHTRYLQIGSQAWWINYVNQLPLEEEWRSNVGDPVVTSALPVYTIQSKTSPLNSFYERLRSIGREYPLFAVDFINRGIGGRLYAIDLNIAPQIKGTGLENKLSPEYVVDEIKAALSTQ